MAEVRSVPSPNHPSAYNDIGSVAAREDLSHPHLADSLYPFQMASFEESLLSAYLDIQTRLTVFTAEAYRSMRMGWNGSLVAARGIVFVGYLLYGESQWTLHMSQLAESLMVRHLVCCA